MGEKAEIISKPYLSLIARKEFICFDLERYERLYFRNIHTYSKERFEEYLQTLRLG